MNLNFGILIAGIVECKHVLTFIRGENQCLFNFIRVEFNAIQFRMILMEFGIIYRCSLYNNGYSVTGDPRDFYCVCNRNSPIRIFTRINRIFTRIKNIFDLIAGCWALRRIVECDNIRFIISCQLQSLAVCIRTITGNGNCLFCNVLPNYIVRVSNNLVCRHRNMGFSIVHITDSIGQHFL